MPKAIVVKDETCFIQGEDGTLHYHATEDYNVKLHMIAIEMKLDKIMKQLSEIQEPSFRVGNL